MAVWIKLGRLEAGFEHGVILKEEFAQLCSMIEACRAAEREAKVLVAMAEAQAQQIVATAVADSREKIEDAERLRKSGFTRGYDKGVEVASEKWASAAIATAQSDRSALERKTERMAQLVTEAVQLIIESEDSVGLYKRALRTVVKSVSNVSTLTLRVSEGEQECARRAIDEIVTQLNCRTPIDVVADRRINLGACVFEYDHGCIDASLDVQLEAIKRAVSRAAQRINSGDVANAPTLDAAGITNDVMPAAGNRAA
jgi:type III secretion protein L